MSAQRSNIQRESDLLARGGGFVQLLRPPPLGCGSATSTNSCINIGRQQLTHDKQRDYKQTHGSVTTLTS